MRFLPFALFKTDDSHHDWGVNGYAESRFITLLLYLTDQESPHAGGETSFPKGVGGRGFKVHPGKGSAVLFYNLLEDGNADDLSLHASLPVRVGEKWLANFWVRKLVAYENAIFVPIITTATFFLNMLA